MEARTPTRLSERLRAMLPRVEHRRADTLAEKEAVYSLRREVADIRRMPNESTFDYSSCRTVEIADEAPNAWITATFIDGELASAATVLIASEGRGWLPCRALFPELVHPFLHAGLVVVELTDIIANMKFATAFPELPYLALRPGWLAAQFFGADAIIATISDDQQNFYRRVFDYAPLGKARPNPAGGGKIACMGLDFLGVRERVEYRYPYLISAPAERDALFNKPPPRFQRCQISESPFRYQQQA